jgi:hypothetical protein
MSTKANTTIAFVAHKPYRDRVKSGLTAGTRVRIGWKLLTVAAASGLACGLALVPVAGAPAVGAAPAVVTPTDFGSTCPGGLANVVTAPAGATALTVTTTGGQGGNGGNAANGGGTTDYGGPGGQGSAVTATIPVTSGEVFAFITGCAGGSGPAGSEPPGGPGAAGTGSTVGSAGFGSNGFFCAGVSGACISGDDGYAGGGGGASAVWKCASTLTCLTDETNTADLLVVAGGGGGGGETMCDGTFGGTGGNGGDPTAGITSLDGGSGPSGQTGGGNSDSGDGGVNDLGKGTAAFPNGAPSNQGVSFGDSAGNGGGGGGFAGGWGSANDGTDCSAGGGGGGGSSWVAPGVSNVAFNLGPNGVTVTDTGIFGNPVDGSITGFFVAPPTITSADTATFTNGHADTFSGARHHRDRRPALRCDPGRQQRRHRDVVGHADPEWQLPHHHHRDQLLGDGNAVLHPRRGPEAGDHQRQ